MINQFILFPLKNIFLNNFIHNLHLNIDYEEHYTNAQ